MIVEIEEVVPVVAIEIQEHAGSDVIRSRRSFDFINVDDFVEIYGSEGPVDVVMLVTVSCEIVPDLVNNRLVVLVDFAGADGLIVMNEGIDFSAVGSSFNSFVG